MNEIVMSNDGAGPTISDIEGEHNIDDSVATNEELTEISEWGDLPVSSDILRGIYAYGFEMPSPIQTKGILPIVRGRDVIAQAQSGTGKTATFVIGALSRIDLDEKTTQVIMLSPTRELSTQIQQVVASIGSSMNGLTTQVLVGGVSMDKTMRALKTDTPHVVVGCVGRVYDMMRRRALDLRSVKLLVIDEADEMLSVGFRDQVYEIVERLPATRQVALFSATMPYDIIDAVYEITKNAVNIVVKKESLTLEGISQYYIALENDEHKYQTLKDLYSSVTMSHCIIYCNSINRVRDLTVAMEADGFPVCCIHSDMDKGAREKSITDFRKGAKRVMISSDITARGIDIQQVSIIINFDVCRSVHTYLHRIGRSGRWGRKGIGINFVTRRDADTLRKIEQHYCTQVNELPTNFMSSVG